MHKGIISRGIRGERLSINQSNKQNSTLFTQSISLRSFRLIAFIFFAFEIDVYLVHSWAEK